MKTPLSYQLSEYDCGPTTLMNAISFLMPRRQVPPDIIKYIHMYSLDGFDGRGQMGRAGTSELAMIFLANCFNQYARARKWPLTCEVLPESDIVIAEDSPVIRGLRHGGVAVTRVYLGVPHYVLLTGIDEEKQALYLFGPTTSPSPSAGAASCASSTTRRTAGTASSTGRCSIARTAATTPSALFRSASASCSIIPA